MKNFIILILSAVFTLVNAYLMAQCDTLGQFLTALLGVLCGGAVCALADNNKF